MSKGGKFSSDWREFHSRLYAFSDNSHSLHEENLSMATSETNNGIDRASLTPEMREMLDQSTREYVGWNPEEQSQVVGTVADIQPACDCGGYGEHYILFIDTPYGEGVAVHAFGTTLRRQVETKIRQGKLSAGDLIAVSYLGSKPSQVKGHSDMQLYGVTVRQKAPAIQFTANGDTI